MVYFQWRTGLIVRQWIVPANPKTGDQLVARSHLTTVTKAWRALSEPQRQAWISRAPTSIR